MFKQVYGNFTCPLDESIVVRLLLNPTGAVKQDWVAGRIVGCAKCVHAEDGAITTYCADCTATRERMGRAWSAVYGETTTHGLVFAPPEAVIPTLTSDEMPDEIVAWLFALPGAVWDDRIAQIEKKLPGSSPTGT